MASSSLLFRMPAPTYCSASGSQRSIPTTTSSSSSIPTSSRRAILLATTTVLGNQMLPLNSNNAALADALDDYSSDTKTVIEQIKQTLALDKADPEKPNAVASLREASNNWVAKYRREKSISGKTSFSNMYSVLNAISGHYISFGPSSPIPAKRQQRILEEVDIAANALERGR